MFAGRPPVSMSTAFPRKDGSGTLQAPTKITSSLPSPVSTARNLKAIVVVSELHRSVLSDAQTAGLRSAEDAVIRTAGIGYTPCVAPIFEPYVAEVNRHIATTSATHGIPCAQVSLGEGYLSPDGVRPNDAGHEAIADGRRELGDEPLNPP